MTYVIQVENEMKFVTETSNKMKSLFRATTEMKSAMELATEVGEANEMKTVMEVPTEWTCKEAEMICAMEVATQVKSTVNENYP